jgi:hypothetical protein
LAVTTGAGNAGGTSAGTAGTVCGGSAGAGLAAGVPWAAAVTVKVQRNPAIRFLIPFIQWFDTMGGARGNYRVAVYQEAKSVSDEFGHQMRVL